MRRRIIIVATFLLAGAIVNVTVGLLCDHFADPPDLQGVRVTDRDLALCRKYAHDDWLSEPVEALETRTLGYLERWCVGATTSATYDIVKVRVGWPTHALGVERWQDDAGSGNDRWGRLPLHPIWRPFAINTLFYAAILWVPIHGLLALRRFIREMPWSLPDVCLAGGLKRQLLIAAIFLLAGAVVNVAVAWGCAIWIEFDRFPQASGRSYEGPGYKGWVAQTFRRRGACRVYSRWHDPDTNPGFFTFVTIDGQVPVIPDWSPLLLPTHEPPTGEFHAYFADARGWPLSSMWSALKLSMPWRIEATPNIETVGIALDPKMMADFNDHRHLRLLPLRLFPLGFAVNTLFYAVILWLLILGPFIPLRVIRFIRTKRGLCPKCAYPMGETAVCSECGKALPSRARVAT